MTPYSVRHSNFGPIAISGFDEINVQPIIRGNDTSVHTGPTQCNQFDFIYTGSRIKWMTTSGPISLASQPPANALLRRPDNNVRVSWTVNAFQGDRIYQVRFMGAFVVGACSDRIIQ
jgi:hypothetical protein